MWLHQTLSFSPWMTAIPKAPAVFWPGCALLGLEPGPLCQTLAVLRRAEPELELAAACCGQPTRFLFPQRLEGRSGRLRANLARQGVRRVYTACPNCTRELAALGAVEVRPVWPLLAELVTRGDLAQGAHPPQGRLCVWHDPCPTRGDPQVQQAVRTLLQMAGCPFTQPEHTGATTLCCGNRGMLHTLQPQRSRELLLRRTGEFPAGAVVLSSCEGCLGAFRGEGWETLHLLELLFGQGGHRSWGNRLKTTRTIRHTL